MNKYLFKKLVQAHGAYIENLIFIPSELSRDRPSSSFKDFQDLDNQEICDTLRWRKDKDVYKAIKENIKDNSFALFIYENNQTGFLAECYFPESSNFRFQEGQEKPFAWSVHSSMCRVEWLYADSIGELVEKIVEKAEHIFDESVEKFKKSTL